MFEHMRIYSIFTSTLSHYASEAMFTKSKDWNDMLTGKMMLYNKSIEKGIMEKIKSVKVR